jgi:hypothetical protein
MDNLHDIAESGVKHNKSNQINQMSERASIFRAQYVLDTTMRKQTQIK